MSKYRKYDNWDIGFFLAMSAIVVALIAAGVWVIIHGDDEENACRALGDGYSWEYERDQVVSTGKTIIIVPVYVCARDDLS